MSAPTVPGSKRPQYFQRPLYHQSVMLLTDFAESPRESIMQRLPPHFATTLCKVVTRRGAVKPTLPIFTILTSPGKSEGSVLVKSDAGYYSARCGGVSLSQWGMSQHGPAVAAAPEEWAFWAAHHHILVAAAVHLPQPNTPQLISASLPDASSGRGPK